MLRIGVHLQYAEGVDPATYVTEVQYPVALASPELQLFVEAGV